MKKFLQTAVLIFGIYTLIHIIFGLDFNPTISLITRICKLLLVICALIYVIKFVNIRE